MIYNILMTALLAAALVRCYLLRKANIKYEAVVDDILTSDSKPLMYQIIHRDTRIEVVSVFQRPVSRKLVFVPIKTFPLYKYYSDRDFARREAEELLDKLKEK